MGVTLVLNWKICKILPRSKRNKKIIWLNHESYKIEYNIGTFIVDSEKQ